MSSDATVALPRQQFEALQSQLRTQGDEIVQLKQQLDWFKNQVFGTKSEKRLEDAASDQAALFQALAGEQGKPAPTIDVPAHKREKRRTGDEVNDTGLRYGPEVPVREIRLSCPELDGPEADRYEIIDYKTSLRLARQPGSHVLLKYLRPVVRHKTEGSLVTAAAPIGVLDHAQVDVSFLAGMAVDKFVYHLPLYRQHQRLADEGIVLSRTTIDAWMSRTIELLSPIAQAIWQQILQGAHLKIDETPIKAGRTKVTSGVHAGQGKMKSGWLWPVLGEQGDIAFGYSGERGAAAVKAFLGKSYQGTIQTDGYRVYAQYAQKLPGCTHALCWAHARRALLKAEQSEPQAVAKALEMIRALYAVERRLKDEAADAAKILAARSSESLVLVDRFFAWLHETIANPALLPQSPLARALAYAKEREAGLRVFLDDAWLDLDTNDLERALRVIPMGRKNWIFCSTEVGARHVATIQTVLATCRAHGVDPYTYLVDVLQRINLTPASEVADLIPRRWAQRFAANPLRSDLATASQ